MDKSYLDCGYCNFHFSTFNNLVWLFHDYEPITLAITSLDVATSTAIDGALPKRKISL
jgi:hypothetical protein